MHCIFCKKDSSSSKSVEYVIPESSGNKKSVLKKELVCDSCNQYFAIKVEKILLEQPYFKYVRNRAGIESKKRKVPKVDITLASDSHAERVELIHSPGRILEINIPGDDFNLNNYLSGGKLIIPMIDEPEKNDPIVSRFLAKAAVEALLLLAIKDGNDILLDEVFNKPEMKWIKQYARYGEGVKYWPYHQRRIYAELAIFRNDKRDLDAYEILNEHQFLYTKDENLFFVLCILGIEYAINIGAPGIEGYINWLKENNNASVLDEADRISL